MAASGSSQGFDDAMPTFENFSVLLNNCDYTKWREMAECLKLSATSLSTISDNLGSDEHRDKKAFLLVLATWRDKAPVRIVARKANWRNLRIALSKFYDIVEGIENIKAGWSGDDGTIDLCDCRKPLALRTKKDAKRTLFTYCPKPRDKQCKNKHFAVVNILLNPKVSRKVEGPPERLRHILLIKRNRELVNFEELAPHLRTTGLLDEDEYLDITQRDGVSRQQHFKLFVTECLLKAGKDNVVQKFIDALRNEKQHKGHDELLKRIEEDERIMNKTEPKRTGGPSKGKKRVMKDDKSEQEDGPLKKKRKSTS